MPGEKVRLMAADSEVLTLVETDMGVSCFGRKETVIKISIQMYISMYARRNALIACCESQQVLSKASCSDSCSVR